eukprot:c19567_g1_i1.p1 GENE.c19567_g1_i1~~c19567_g1_i1.p1  ORF type:complete len:199 (+),score=55.79 c19567_g1_i1:180-776(+)
MNWDRLKGTYQGNPRVIELERKMNGAETQVRQGLSWLRKNCDKNFELGLLSEAGKALQIQQIDDLEGAFKRCTAVRTGKKVTEWRTAEDLTAEDMQGIRTYFKERDMRRDEKLLEFAEQLKQIRQIAVSMDETIRDQNNQLVTMQKGVETAGSNMNKLNKRTGDIKEEVGKSDRICVHAVMLFIIAGLVMYIIKMFTS